MYKKFSGTLNTLFGIAAAIALGLAIREQVSLPPAERTWHGKVAGIPYDFRIPTVDRLRDTFWNKNTSRVLVPQAFGMGWTINFYPLVNPRTLPPGQELQ
jgi:hypothetical protein